MPPSPFEEPDALSAALRALQLRGRVFCSSRFSAPWSVAFPAGPVYFHVVEHGACWIAAPGASAQTAAVAGDLVILPRGRGHRISGARDGRAVPLEQVLRAGVSGFTLRWGGGGRETHLICGSFDVEPVAGGTLASLLPAVLLVPGSHGRAAGWLALVLRALAAEVRRRSPGAELARSRLVDLLFVQALRHWLSGLPHGEGGWLGAMRDPQIARALGRMHAEPERRWSAGELARAAGMSRSGFSARFASLVGEPPLRHLARWRMSLAATLLRDGVLRGQEIADRLGYRSDAAFSRAFKRHTGLAPRRFRRGSPGGGEEVERPPVSAGSAPL